MKKLVVFGAVAVMAIASQAAQVVWGSGVGITDSKGNAITAADVLSAQVWEISAADFATYSAMDAATLTKTIGEMYGKGEIPAGFTSVGTGSNTYNKKNGAKLDITGSADHAAGTTAYGIILYADTTNPGQVFVNVASADIEGAQNVTVGNLGTVFKGAGGGAPSWGSTSPTPEPTSGLLLLLGVAGLALRRKQK